MSEFDPSEHPHRRYNPLTGEHVLVSPHRTKRPWHGQSEASESSSLLQHDPACHLCPGNTRSGGHTNPRYSSTYTFSNDFPALLSPPIPVPPAAPHPLLQAAPLHGKCDVIIFHPRHDLSISRLSIPHIKHVIAEWTRIYITRGDEPGIAYVQIFENKGSIMGCSNPHPHGQVWSMSEVPSIPSTELMNLTKYRLSSPPASAAPLTTYGCPNLLLEYAFYELGITGDERRVVILNDHWMALVPWWAVWPFEVLVLPYRRHIPSLCQLTEEEVDAFADVLSRLTIKYDNLFETSFAYSMGIHQRPIPLPKDVNRDDQYPDAHLHLHFTPPLLRSATVRKFLVGFELMAEPQRDLTPEQAAQRLRAVSDVHYLNKTDHVR
ncbi:galactose-1-phosphate uridyl transferase [Sistotremastrum niveocremeum HHB9708]|uniref:Galactose-1-phosphate uridylyltransferase n=2 Tax=Sistotremastraceae TaxID=3402574 RepID=A0A165AN07_9AGAM|nr:galactose-1-phosphate uridyl transferase [Sistotremastrum niveocremeum HHB9708]KZT36980.1 galactose-1-phosphate uridyl transferase [Sistotremastrum suecicum HHB10207 ss-3]